MLFGGTDPKVIVLFIFLFLNNSYAFHKFVVPGLLKEYD
jgi:hypothetical protein